MDWPLGYDFLTQVSVRRELATYLGLDSLIIVTLLIYFNFKKTLIYYNQKLKKESQMKMLAVLFFPSIVMFSVVS